MEKGDKRSELLKECEMILGDSDPLLVAIREAKITRHFLAEALAKVDHHISVLIESAVDRAERARMDEYTLNDTI